MIEQVPTTPDFCFITPTAYLDRFAAQTKRHLVLAHLVDRDATYREFYRHRGECGDYIMMDNSAYELLEPYSPDKLLHLAGQCGASAIVLPDYPFQPAEKTVEAAEKFAPIFADAGYHNFFVPQSKRGDTDDWIAAYEYASDNPLIDIIGMSILGIPNALPAIDPAYARVVMTQLLQDRGIFSEKAHHYLGLNSGPRLEIPSLLRMDALTSIDSSGPVWAGILGHSYTFDADSFQQVSKLKMPVDFNLPLSKDAVTLNRIQHNIDLTLSLFVGSNDNSVWYAHE